MEKIEDITISGMILTDTEMNYYTCMDTLNNRLPIISACDDSDIRNFDKEMLKQFMLDCPIDKTLFVTGNNNFESMKKAFTKIFNRTHEFKIDFLCSSPDSIDLKSLEKDRNGPSDVYNELPKKHISECNYPDNSEYYQNQLVRECIRLCSEMNKTHVKVLGGNSVYKAFMRMYDIFYHCQIDLNKVSLKNDYTFPDVIDNFIEPLKANMVKSSLIHKDSQYYIRKVFQNLNKQ
ncbi:hypothetical protein PBI_SCTP2_463 [Salicola phage SCTP-2]|nr:hypothetical protein PBI_SCTP2_463 [Salicola phage SCTP-2]